MTEILLPTFDPRQFPADVLQKYGIDNPEALLPLKGLVPLSALLIVNKQCREIFEAQVEMSLGRWYQTACQVYHLNLE